MALVSAFAAGAITDTSTTALYKLGEVTVTNDSTYGTRFWRYILNGDVASLTVGMTVEKKATTVSPGTGIICVTAKKARTALLGVAAHTIAAASYGWIVCSGEGYIAGGGSVTDGSPVTTNGTAGQVANATLTNADEAASFFATALEDDGAAASTFRALIHLL